MAWKVELTVQEAHLIGYALDKIGPFVLDMDAIEKVDANKAEMTNSRVSKSELNLLRHSLLKKFGTEYCFEKDITELQVKHKGDPGFIKSENLIEQ